MWLDALLAYLHYISIFTLIVFLAAEAVVLHPDTAPGIRKHLRRYDAVYGVAAVAVVVTGVLRVIYDAEGYTFYVHNPILHTEIGLFILVELTLIVPTINILHWKKQDKTLSGFVPTPSEATKTHRWVMVKSRLIIFAPLATVLMARGIDMQLHRGPRNRAVRPQCYLGQRQGQTLNRLPKVLRRLMKQHTLPSASCSETGPFGVQTWSPYQA